MKTIFHENFALDSKPARRLYHDYIASLPIIDYHTHLDAVAIAEDFSYPNLSEMWLEHDHYKWRAMRTMGIEEKYITGNAGDREKFHWWAKTIHASVRNPLYHWTHLELSRIFQIHRYLSPDTAEEIYNQTEKLLSTPEFSTNSIIRKMNVEFIGTTDDPVDSLESHQRIKLNIKDFTVAPTFRPDRFIYLENLPVWKEAIGQLELVEDIPIRNYTDLWEALKRRMDHFGQNGCSLADVSLSTIPIIPEGSRLDGETIFGRAWNGETLTPEEIAVLRVRLLVDMAKEFSRRNWVLQLHLLAQRNNNTRMFQTLGRDAGFDSMGEGEVAKGLNALLDAMEQNDALPQTILYTLNPAYNAVIASAMGNFQKAPIRGKLQFGSAWWFNDQWEGMKNQMETLSAMGLISTFVGMLTDSRSFLSFTRHEYFRRILANLFGEDMQKGRLPMDYPYIGGILRDIAYFNAREYFHITRHKGD